VDLVRRRRRRSNTNLTFKMFGEHFTRAYGNVETPMCLHLDLAVVLMESRQ
jgi:hypothetical protein